MRSADKGNEYSAGGIVFRPVADRLMVLMIRDRYGHWGFPKGHIESGEDPVGAARREIGEETGVSDLNLVEDLGTIDWHFRHQGELIHKFCRFFLFESVCGNPRPQQEEGIERAEWLAYDDALALVSYDNAREVLRRGRDALSRRPRSDAQRAG